MCGLLVSDVTVFINPARYMYKNKNKKKVCKVCIYNFHDFVNHILHQRVNFTLGKLTINFKAFFLLTGPYQNLKTVKESITDRLNF